MKKNSLPYSPTFILFLLFFVSLYLPTSLTPLPPHQFFSSYFFPFLLFFVLFPSFSSSTYFLLFFFLFLYLLFLLVLLRFSYSISSLTSYYFESSFFFLSTFPPPSSLPNPLHHPSSLASLSLPHRPHCASISLHLLLSVPSQKSLFSLPLLLLPPFFLYSLRLFLHHHTPFLLLLFLLPLLLPQHNNLSCKHLLSDDSYVSGNVWETQQHPRLLADCRLLRVFISAVNPVPATE
jgi:hypothetical protein